jgi:hypothetical protein
MYFCRHKNKTLVQYWMGINFLSMKDICNCFCFYNHDYIKGYLHSTTKSCRATLRDRRHTDRIASNLVATLRDIAQHFATLHNIARHCATLHNIARHCATLCDIARHCATLRDNARHCATLRDIAQHCTTFRDIPRHCATLRDRIFIVRVNRP